jgi:hypothetical protein
MLSIDVIIAVAYVAALLTLKRNEYIHCVFSFVVTVIFATILKEVFSVENNGIECLYFLILSMIWLFCAIKINCIKLKIAVMIMSTYELMCAIESFIWQFSHQVLTPIISNYIYNVVFIHFIIILSINIWGVKIERPMERIFSYGKYFIFNLLGSKRMARDNAEIKG